MNTNQVSDNSIRRAFPVNDSIESLPKDKLLSEKISTIVHLALSNFSKLLVSIAFISLVGIAITIITGSSFLPVFIGVLLISTATLSQEISKMKNLEQESVASIKVSAIQVLSDLSNKLILLAKDNFVEKEIIEQDLHTATVYLNKFIERIERSSCLPLKNSKPLFIKKVEALENSLKNISSADLQDYTRKFNLEIFSISSLILKVQGSITENTHHLS